MEPKTINDHEPTIEILKDNLPELSKGLKHEQQRKLPTEEERGTDKTQIVESEIADNQVSAKRKIQGFTMTPLEDNWTEVAKAKVKKINKVKPGPDYHIDMSVMKSLEDQYLNKKSGLSKKDVSSLIEQQSNKINHVQSADLKESTTDSEILKEWYILIMLRQFQKSHNTSPHQLAAGLMEEQINTTIIKEAWNELKTMIAEQKKNKPWWSLSKYRK
jgi:hypothetical protein